MGLLGKKGKASVGMGITTKVRLPCVPMLARMPILSSDMAIMAEMYWLCSQDIDVAVQKATRGHLPEDPPKEKHVVGTSLSSSFLDACHVLNTRWFMQR